VYADDVNIMDGNINTIKNTETLLVVTREVCLEVSKDKTKYMVMSCYESAEQSRSLHIANTSFENVAKFKYREQQ
jgi:hypothetical protein